MTAKEVTNAFSMLSGQLQQVQAALAARKLTAADLGQSLIRGGDSGGIIGAIKRGQMKEIAPKKYTNMQVSGNFKSGAGDTK